MKVENGRVIASAEKANEKLTFEADKVLVSVGRKPFSEGLGAEKVGVEFDERKRIKIDKHFRTNVEGIYAIGDVIAGPMLAHKAEDEGIACVEIIAGKSGHVNYDAIPGIIYTNPELAGVGITEDQAKEKGMEVRIGKFPFRANGRALANEDVEGLVKFIADAKTDKILGAHILQHAASELIAEPTSVIEFGGSSEDLGPTTHSHPTLSEAVKEAAMAVEKRAYNCESLVQDRALRRWRGAAAVAGDRSRICCGIRLTTTLTKFGRSEKDVLPVREAAVAIFQVAAVDSRRAIKIRVMIAAIRQMIAPKPSANGFPKNVRPLLLPDFPPSRAEDEPPNTHHVTAHFVRTMICNVGSKLRKIEAFRIRQGAKATAR